MYAMGEEKVPTGEMSMDEMALKVPLWAGLEMAEIREKLKPPHY